MKITIQSHSLASTLFFKDGRTEVSGMVHGQKKKEDHGYKNFVFPNRENKQVKHSF